MAEITGWPAGKYATVVIDPPWKAKGYSTGHPDRGRGGGRHGPPHHMDFDFPLMMLDEIAALDIPGILADDAFVFLWTINRFIRDAYDLLDGWRLRYMCMMAWHKPNGPKPIGYPIYNMEQILVAKRGRPQFLDTKDFRTANFWEAPRNLNAVAGAWGRQIRHCTKPEGFYDLLRRVTPEPRIDLFARRRIDGFDGWGNELEASNG